MVKLNLYILRICLSYALCLVVFSCSKKDHTEFSERVKIALRDVGNKILLKEKDSTSVIKPVIEVSPKKYQLSFSTDLTFTPNDLVLFTQENMKAAKLPDFYRVEVKQCLDEEVAYSYQISADKESTIIPCLGRVLPKNCYLIEIKFANDISVPFTRQGFFYGYAILITVLLLFYFYKKKKAATDTAITSYNVGSFKFYPEQNKLVKSSDEISLSKKECELLSIFVANPNTIIKRDELTKRVWEDNGVIVGRSLDTYISKLRKKLKDDESIKLTNVHGVGYKLEVS